MAASTNRYDANLAINIFNNEGLNQPVIIKQSTNGVVAVQNLTGAEFRSSVLTSTQANGSLVCDLTVTVTNASAGLISIRLTSNVASTITPGNYVYDVLMKLPDAEIYRVWAAPFIVSRGQTVWV